MTPDQIVAQFKQAHPTLAAASSSNSPSDWLSGVQSGAYRPQGAPVPAQPSHTLENIGSFAGPVGAAIGRTFDNPGAIADAAKAGIKQMKEGFDQSNTAQDPLSLGEGALKMGAGAANAAFSPAAPAMKPLGDAVTAIGNAAGDNKQLQDFATSDAGAKTIRGVDDLNNANTMFGAVAGGPKVGEGAADVAKAVPKATTEAISKISKKTTPESAATADATEHAKAHTAIEDEIRNTAAMYPTVGKVLNHSEVTRGSEPIKVLSSYPGGKALPTLIKCKKQFDNPVDFLKTQVARLSDIKDNLVASGKDVTPVPDFLARTNDIIDAQKGWSLAKKTSMKADAKNMIDGWKKIYPDGIPNTELDNLKTEHTAESNSYNSKSPFNLDAHAVVGKAARQLVEKNAGTAPISELNKLISSHYDAIKLLGTMRGKTPHGGRLTRMFNNTLGEVGGFAGGMAIGHPFLGAMAGRAGAEAINEIINNHFISNPLKRSLVNNMKGADPQVVQTALEHLNPEGPQTASTEPTEDTSSGNSSTEAAPVKRQSGERGMIKNPFAGGEKPAKPIYLHPEDQHSLIKYVDAVRLRGKPSAPPMTEDDWNAAERILTKAGVSLDTSQAKLAHAAEELVNGDRNSSMFAKTGRKFKDE